MAEATFFHAPLSSTRYRNPDRSVRILAVDDSPVNRQLALRQLQKLGHLAEAVASGTAALEVADKETFDLFLMDCQMPGLDGFETARRIRRSEERSGRRSIIIIAISASLLGLKRMIATWAERMTAGSRMP